MNPFWLKSKGSRCLETHAADENYCFSSAALSCTTLRVIGITTRSVVQLNPG